MGIQDRLIQGMVVNAMQAAIRIAMIAGASLMLSGCFLPGLVAFTSDNVERSKNVEILAKYSGLENHTAAVLIHADMTVQYDHPVAVANMSLNLASKLQSEVAGLRLLDQRLTLEWMHRNPSWVTMPLSEVAMELDVERLVIIDLYEFRLHPPGNRWQWEGVAAANIGIVEADGLDPDAHADEFNIVATFPDVDGLAREAATWQQIELGLQKTFLDSTAFLFYDHVVPKHPE
ncbi:MAG: hypothetical protein O2800_04450 [Planctomycetota bacterium]|nr:hypothetical protein [Planctomycetota bacterium]